MQKPFFFFFCNVLGLGERRKLEERTLLGIPSHGIPDVLTGP